MIEIQRIAEVAVLRDVTEQRIGERRCIERRTARETRGAQAEEMITETVAADTPGIAVGEWCAQSKTAGDDRGGGCVKGEVACRGITARCQGEA